MRIEGRQVPKEHRDRRYTPLWIDEDAGYRYWMSALYVRAVMAFESSLLLAQAGLDPDARAHVRIMFDHLVAFAWLGAEPADGTRSFRLGRYGSDFRERMLLEIAGVDGPSEELVNDLALAMEINEKVSPPPSIQSMCRELDEVWAARLPFLTSGTGASFSAWFTRVYRGASGFLHVTTAGIDAVMTVDRTAFVVDRTRETINRVLEIGIGLLAALLEISAEAAPWLVDSESLAPLEGLIDLVDIGDVQDV